MSTATAAATKTVADLTSRLLADSYLVYLKTHNFHWNVKGPMFGTLHAMFEVQYTELATALDEIAERIRAIGYPAPGSFSEFAELSKVQESRGAKSAIEMIEELSGDLETITETANELMRAAEEAGDDVSVDLAVRRSDVTQKNIWLLRSHLE
jgi:starvation-inducible DNA-binding protein